MVEPPDRDSLAATIRLRNLRGRDAWDRFAGHRAEVTRHLLAAATRLSPTGPAPVATQADQSPSIAGQTQTSARLGVLGAGNLNDLDLRCLLERFSTIELFDLDKEAVCDGLQRQQYGTDPRIMVHEVEVTGLGHLLSQCSPETTLRDATLQACFERTSTVNLLGVVQPFDVTASVCLLTQLIDSVVQTLGENHPECHALSLAIRDQHLDQLCQLTRPGGRIVLITDVVSSDSYPALSKTPAADLPRVVAGLIHHGNFFTGTNPFAIRAKLQSDPRYESHVGPITLGNPWLWNLGPRYYAVCVLTIDRPHAPPVPAP